MRIYISGPITGIKNENREGFQKAVDALSGDDHFDSWVNPIDIGESLTDDNPTWSDYMKADIKALVDCDAILMIPGWEQSKGANVERNLALALGMKEFTLFPTGIFQLGE